MRKGKQITSFILVALLLLGITSPAMVYAGDASSLLESEQDNTNNNEYMNNEFSYLLDETAYVNLDYYGKLDTMSIVKCISPLAPNGLLYTDYGKYKSVNNMSGNFDYVMQDNTLTWDIPKELDRLYYECVPQDTADIIPWDINIDYKLNGLPADPATLAGAHGLVEIHVVGHPNDKTTEYIKNNMLLEVIFLPDEKHTKKVEVEGGVLQTIGGMQLAGYIVLPDTDFDLTFEVVSDKFECMGIQMIMQPITLEVLDVLQDFKESKDNIKTAVDALYDSLDATLADTSGMKDEISGLSGALQNFETARSTISASSDNLHEMTDESLSNIKKMVESLNTASAHITKVKEDVNSALEELNLINDNMSKLKLYLEDLAKEIENITEDMNQLEDVIDDAQDNLADLDEVRKSFRKHVNGLEFILKNMSSEMTTLKKRLNNLGTNIGTLEEQLSSISEDAASQELVMMAGAMSPVLISFENLMEQLTTITGAMPDIMKNGQENAETMEDLLTVLGNTTDILDEGLTLGNESAHDMNSLGKTSGKIIDNGADLTDNITALIQLFTDNEQSINAMMDDTETLLTTTVDALTSTTNTLSSFHQVMNNSRSDIDLGSEELIDNGISLLDETQKIVNRADSIRDAGSVIKNELDRQSDELDDDLSFIFNMDPDAKKVSFTSEQNSEPNTLQIVMRTTEINIEEQEKELQRLDNDVSEDVGIFTRIKNLFSAIYMEVTNVINL